jgi:hypothetical protein
MNNKIQRLYEKRSRQMNNPTSIPSIFISGEIHSSKNSRRILNSKKRGKKGQRLSFIAKSKEAKQDEGIFAEQLNRKKEDWDAMIQGHEYPLRLVFTFVRSTKCLFDYVNMAQGILDAMVKAEYLPDDNMNYVIPVFKPYVVDKEKPGCRIEIESKCRWHVGDGEWTMWDASCGLVWAFDEGTPTENEMQYCPKCGRELEEVIDPVEEAEEE